MGELKITAKTSALAQEALAALDYLLEAGIDGVRIYQLDGRSSLRGPLPRCGTVRWMGATRTWCRKHWNPEGEAAQLHACKLFMAARALSDDLGTAGRRESADRLCHMVEHLADAIDGLDLDAAVLEAERGELERLARLRVATPRKERRPSAEWQQEARNYIEGNPGASDRQVANHVRQTHPTISHTTISRWRRRIWLKRPGEIHAALRKHRTIHPESTPRQMAKGTGIPLTLVRTWLKEEERRERREQRAEDTATGSTAPLTSRDVAYEAGLRERRR